MAALPAVTPIMRNRSRRLGEYTSDSLGIATSTVKNGSRTRAVGEMIMRAVAFITRTATAIKAAAGRGRLAAAAPGANTVHTGRGYCINFEKLGNAQDEPEAGDGAGEAGDGAGS